MKRKSNFELLRIISMFMIIIFHLAYHSKLGIDSNNITTNSIWLYFLKTLGKVGVNIFVLISGYFLLYSDKVKISKILKLWLQIIFYSITIFIIFIVFKHTPININTITTNCFPIISRIWWFATTYMLLYMFSPLINKLIRSLDRKTYKRYLILATICFSLFQTIYIKSMHGDFFIWFIYLYFIAGYIRLYKDNDKISPDRCLCYCSVITLFSILYFVLISLLSLKYSYFISYRYLWTDWFSLPSLLVALFMFLAFKNININSSKIINTISSTTFSIYLIHDNNLLRPYLWSSIFKIKNYYGRVCFIPYTILVALIIFVVCFIIDIIRVKLIEKRYIKYIDIISNKIEKIIDKI